MINVSDVATGLLGLGVIAAAVGLVALGGRDRTADQHDLDDYQPAVHPSRRAWPLLDRQAGGPRRLRPAALADLLPPAPAADARAPLYVETLFRTWYPESPADVAARMLREIAAEQSYDDVIWNSTADADLTGAFPVVRAA